MNKKKIAFIGRAFDDNWELNDPTGKVMMMSRILLER